ncbi:MAG: tRNA (adenosine(37)-N6)-dimethylallyltransferase MiaA, partial [Ignavibacteriales bacterium]|nr:tRNA (adenosine(37)-N6)-dimethylallyltransferase MiaA [Ignavibacteriales bacterium]
MAAKLDKNGTTKPENRVIIIAGPTCSGKTIVALQIAKALGTEIISADSRQIYTKTNIGTAKPTSEELLQVKHHFIDAIPPEQIFNAGLFEKEALGIIASLHTDGKIPVVAGGTGLYIRALVDGIIDVEIAEDLHLHLMEELQASSNEAMYMFLQKIDAAAAATMMPQNWKRVIRALEVKLGTGSSILDLHHDQNRHKNINFLQFGLLWERDDMYERINNRVDAMMQNGLLNEVKLLQREGLTPLINALNTVGYKELFDKKKKKFPLEEAVRLIKRNTRRYAKRQMTWF